MASEWDVFAREDDDEFAQFDIDHDFDAMNMIKNIPGSAAQLGKDIWGAVSSPIDTAKGVAALGGSALAKGQRKVRELAAGTDIEAGEDEAVADAVWNAVLDRYGSVEKLQRTLEEDPVGLMSDLSGVLGLAGKTAKAGKLSKVGDVLEQGARATDPLAAPGLALKIDPQAKAADWYASAAKFPTTLRNREKVIQSALDQGIRPGKRGVRKLEERLSASEDRLGKMVDEATELGQNIHVNRVFQHVLPLRQGKTGFKAEGKEDLAKIDQVVTKALKSLEGREFVTPRELQDFKVDLYNKIYNRRMSADGNKRRGTKTEAQSAVARGAKDALTDTVRGSREVNKTLSDLYTLRAPLERATNRIQNANKIPARALFSGGGAGAVAFLGGGPIATVATVIVPWLIDNPAVKSRMALAINKIKKGQLEAAEKALQGSNEIRAAMALAGRTEEELEELGLLE